MFSSQLAVDCFRVGSVIAPDVEKDWPRRERSVGVSWLRGSELNSRSSGWVFGPGVGPPSSVWLSTLIRETRSGDEVRVEGWALFPGLEPRVDGARTGPPNLTELVELFFRWLLTVNTGAVARLEVGREPTLCLPLK